MNKLQIRNPRKIYLLLKDKYLQSSVYDTFSIMWENISIWFCPDSLILALAFSSSPFILFQRIFHCQQKNESSAILVVVHLKLLALFCPVTCPYQEKGHAESKKVGAG